MKKNILTAVLFTLTMGAIGTVHAGPHSAISAVNNQVFVDVVHQDMEYNEFNSVGHPGVDPDYNNGYFDSEEGSQIGLRVGATKQGELFGVENVYLAANLSYVAGDTDYTGYLQNQSGTLVPYSTTTDNTMLDFGVKGGVGFVMGDKAQITPYVGYEYHQWVRDIGNDTPYNVYETYSYHALSVGALGQYVFTPKLVGHADLSIGRTINASMDYRGISDEFDLGSKLLTRLDMGVTYRLDNNWNIRGGVALTKYEYGYVLRRRVKNLRWNGVNAA